MQDTIKDTTVYTFLAFTVRPNKHKGLFPKIGMMGRLKSHSLCSNESSKSYNFCRFCRSVLSFQTRTMRREKINLVAELGYCEYCLKTEVFLCCQITDILSENKNKTQCIALQEPSAKTSNQQELNQPNFNIQIVINIKHCIIYYSFIVQQLIIMYPTFLLDKLKYCLTPSRNKHSQIRKFVSVSKILRF